MKIHTQPCFRRVTSSSGLVVDNILVAELIRKRGRELIVRPELELYMAEKLGAKPVTNWSTDSKDGSKRRVR